MKGMGHCLQRLKSHEESQSKIVVQLYYRLCIIVLALFLSAGTFDYWQAWGFLAVGFVTSILLAQYISKDPILLEGRSKAGYAPEQRLLQKIIVFSLIPIWVAAFVVPGLDHRFRLVERAAFLRHRREFVDTSKFVDGLSESEASWLYETFHPSFRPLIPGMQAADGACRST